EQDELENRYSVLIHAMDNLNEREKRIFKARRLREDPLTLEELSNEFNISRERVRQIEARAFEKIQNSIKTSALFQKKVQDQVYLHKSAK
ncbi:MAG: sigma-70 family RNA polymerase sigma factor, partial [Bartonella sp.]|nr:sigma-70 family RNA polymerase sigma factor [Bartonella sp.]